MAVADRDRIRAQWGILERLERAEALLRELAG